MPKEKFENGDAVTYRGADAVVSHVTPAGKLVLMVNVNGWTRVPGEIDPANVKPRREA